LILALDPSLAFFGALVISPDLNPTTARARWCATKPDRSIAGRADDDIARLRALRVFLDSMTELCDVTSRDFRLVIEQPTGAHGPRSHHCPACDAEHDPGIYRPAKSEGMMLALLATWADLRSLPIHWVRPRDVKKALLGKPSGSKDEMVSAAMLHIPDTLTEKRVTKPARETIADCYGVARALTLHGAGS
jgi:hypothetical protein